MAHPKRRQSKTRTLKRRTHDKAVAPTLAVCPNCGGYALLVACIVVRLLLLRTKLLSNIR